MLAVSGVVLGAWYMLWLVQRVFFGPLRRSRIIRTTRSSPVRDLSLREIAALAPLAGVHLLDRPAPRVLPEPHAADARAAWPAMPRRCSRTVPDGATPVVGRPSDRRLRRDIRA